MEIYIYWFLLALGLLVAEMASGTFYMLVLAIAFAIGGSAALLGLEISLQLLAAALAGFAGVVLLRRSKAAHPAQVNDQSLDIGQPVKVVKWNEDGTVRVQYRGAEWDAEPELADTPRDGSLYIKSMRGSTLILSHNKPQ